jgi:NAD(P)H-hydrate epimerase
MYISVAQAQAFDRLVQEKYGVPSIVLMENAGRSVAEEAINAQEIMVLCGMGNNGGDGFVAARHLLNQGKHVSLFLLGEKEKVKADAKTNLEILLKMGQKVYGKEEFKLSGKEDLIIDAVFGIGLNSDVREPYKTFFEKVNQAKTPVLAVDVPSGLNADSGKIMGAAIRATTTITFIAPKIGFTFLDGPAYCGKVVVRDIGISYPLITCQLDVGSCPQYRIVIENRVTGSTKLPKNA